MGIVEREIRSQQVGFGRLDFSSASAEVEDQVLDVENGFKDAFRLAVKEFAEEGRVPEGNGKGNRRHGGIKSAAGDAESGSLRFGLLPRDACLGVMLLGQVDKFGECIGIVG